MNWIAIIPMCTLGAGLFFSFAVPNVIIPAYQGKFVKELEKAFKDSVDDYLELCKGRGEKLDKPFTGKFVVRLSVPLCR